MTCGKGVNARVAVKTQTVDEHEHAMEYPGVGLGGSTSEIFLRSFSSVSPTGRTWSKVHTVAGLGLSNLSQVSWFLQIPRLTRTFFGWHSFESIHRDGQQRTYESSQSQITVK